MLLFVKHSFKCNNVVTKNSFNSSIKMKKKSVKLGVRSDMTVIKTLEIVHSTVVLEKDPIILKLKQ